MRKKESNYSDSLDERQYNIDLAFEEKVDLVNRVVYIDSEIRDDKFFHKFDLALSLMEKENNNPITIKINSGGGDITAALAIIGRMHSSPCQVNTEAYGRAMSAAFYILSQGSTRKASKYCWGMFHDISVSTEGTRAYVANEVKFLNNVLNQFYSMLEKKTKKSKEFWSKQLKKEDLYLNPEQMLEYGLIDEII